MNKYYFKVQTFIPTNTLISNDPTNEFNALGMNGHMKYKLCFKEHTTNTPTKFEMVADYSPFGNCQIFSIAHFRQFLDVFGWELEVFKAFSNRLYQSLPKSTLIIDINVSEVEHKKFKENFKSIIKAEMPYVNRTGSNMCIFLLDVGSLLLASSVENSLIRKYFIEYPVDTPTPPKPAPSQSFLQYVSLDAITRNF